jgi:hypothetical protein
MNNLMEEFRKWSFKVILKLYGYDYKIKTNDIYHNDNIYEFELSDLIYSMRNSSQIESIQVRSAEYWKHITISGVWDKTFKRYNYDKSKTDICPRHIFKDFYKKQ